MPDTPRHPQGAAAPANARRCRGVTGRHGAVSAGHPLAAEAGAEVLRRGGTALDAAIAAQAVVCTVMPQAAGLGGDMLALIHVDGVVTAVGGTGASPARAPRRFATDGGSSVTVPGIVDAWVIAHRRFGRMPLPDILAPAARLAREGTPVDTALHRAVTAQRDRIGRYGCAGWDLLGLPPGRVWRQPELAGLLERIGTAGRDAFYRGEAARAVAVSVAATGGTLDEADLAAHTTAVGAPVETGWDGSRLCVQPPWTQGTLLAMAARWLNARWHDGAITTANLQHVLVEVTEAVFASRSDAALGAALLDRPLEVDVERAANRGGPRAYLHTAGVAAADADGMAVSSLISVFDDFGSGVFVPQLGIVLNNRAAGFTVGANAPAPAKRPVHTLAPAMLVAPSGDVLALATPGADGQIQTLLQVLVRMRRAASLPEALAAPRWRSEDGALLIEDDHEALPDLRRRGHAVAPRTAGDDVFGGVVAAGIRAGIPHAASDWRRLVTTGAA